MTEEDAITRVYADEEESHQYRSLTLKRHATGVWDALHADERIERFRPTAFKTEIELRRYLDALADQAGEPRIGGDD